MSEQQDREDDFSEKDRPQNRFSQFFRRRSNQDRGKNRAEGQDDNQRRSGDWGQENSTLSNYYKPAARKPYASGRTKQYRRYGSDDEVGSRYKDEQINERRAYREVEPEFPERTLRRKGDVKPPPDLNLPAGMLQCEICQALVPRTRMLEHMQSRHTEQPEVEMEACPSCKALVRADRLEKHLRKVHPEDYQ